MSSEIDEQIAFLQSFNADILAHFDGHKDGALRVRINRGIPRARDILARAGALKSVSLSPPPAIGGMIVRNADPFEFILQDYFGMSMAPMVSDMIEQAIGILDSPEYRRDAEHVNKRKPKRSKEPISVPLPDKVTLSWLVRHVPIKFWLWLIGIVTAAFGVGVKLAPFLSPS